MFKKILFSLFVIITSLNAVLLINPLVVYGGGIIPDDHSTAETCPNGYQGNCGDYELDDFIVLAIKVSQWILGIVGSLSLLMFIYGGLSFLISTGSSDKITKAKDIIVAAIIGLVIVFSSYLIIKFVMQSMGLSWSGQNEKPTIISTPK